MEQLWIERQTELQTVLLEMVLELKLEEIEQMQVQQLELAMPMPQDLICGLSGNFCC